MLLFAAIVAIFVYGMVAAMLGTILPGLSARFNLSPAQNGTIAFAQALGLMIASVGVGPLLDTEGDKIGLVLGLVLIAAPVFALTRARRYAHIVALFFLLGVGAGIVVTGVNALSSAANPAHRAIVLNLVNLFFGLGGMVAPFLSANLLAKNGPRLCFAVAALSVIALAVQVATPMPAPAGAQGFALAQAGPMLAQPLLLLLSLFLFLYVACEVGVWNWLPRHLIAQGIPESRALNILSFGFALGLIVGRLGVSVLLGTVPPVNALMAASTAMAVSTFLMLRTQRAAVAAALVFVAGVAMAPVFPTTLAVVGGAFPHMTATAIGFAITCGWAGIAVSSRIIGAIAGPDPARLRTALLVIPGAAVLMTGLAVAIGETLR